MTSELHTFVFADLAGFTALAEAHGDERAADIATEFCQNVNRLLPEGGRDLKMTGDACLLRLDTAAQAVALGLALTGELATRHGFPDVRVGMNTGPAARREQEWFGRAINISARVASLAGPGEVLLTEASFRLYTDLPDVELEDVGVRELRHVRNPVRLYRARRRPAESVPGTSWFRDPVCHMRLDGDRAATSMQYLGRTVYFCSEACSYAFAASPVHYPVAALG